MERGEGGKGGEQGHILARMNLSLYPQILADMESIHRRAKPPWNPCALTTKQL